MEIYDLVCLSNMKSSYESFLWGKTYIVEGVGLIDFYNVLKLKKKQVDLPKRKKEEVKI